MRGVVHFRKQVRAGFVSRSARGERHIVGDIGIEGKGHIRKLVLKECVHNLNIYKDLYSYIPSCLRISEVASSGGVRIEVS